MGLAEMRMPREEQGVWRLLDTAGVFTPAGVGVHSASFHMKDGVLRNGQPRRFVPAADVEKLHRHFPSSPHAHEFIC